MQVKNEAVDKLVAELAALDQKRMAVLEEARAKKAELTAALYADQAAKWGLTADEYRAACKPKMDRLKAEGDLHAAQTQIAKLTAKAANPKFKEEQRKELADTVAKLQATISTLEAARQTASYEPLSVLLQRARVAKGLAIKDVQGKAVSTTGARV